MLPSPDPIVMRVPLFFDFASTICYFTHRVMERVEPELDRLGIELVWAPLDLALITGWPRAQAYDEDRRSKIARLSAELDIPVRAPAVWMDSRPVLARHLALGQAEAAGRWRRAVWRWVYEEGHSLQEPDAEEAISHIASLPPARIDERQLQTVTRVTREAFALGVRGVPTFQLGDWPVGIGVQEPATMLDFLRRYAEREAAAPSSH